MSPLLSRLSDSRRGDMWLKTAGFRHVTFSAQHASRNAGCRAGASGGPLASWDALIYFSADALSLLHLCFPERTKTTPRPHWRPRLLLPARTFTCRWRVESGHEPLLHSFIPSRLEFNSVWPDSDSGFSREKSETAVESNNSGYCLYYKNIHSTVKTTALN